MKTSHLCIRFAALAIVVSPLAMALESVDTKFIDQAASAGKAEVELADLAEQKATTDAVRKFAQSVKKDHEQANEKLHTIVSQKGVELPAQPASKQQREKDRLAKLEGNKFDREYAEAMVKDHKKVIDNFEKEAKDGKDADLKTFAAQSLPKLREHLEHAKQLEKDAKKSSS